MYKLLEKFEHYYLSHEFLLESSFRVDNKELQIKQDLTHFSFSFFSSDFTRFYSSF